MVGEQDTRSEIDIPLKIRDEVIGVFNVQHIEMNAFSPERIRLLEALAAEFGAQGIRINAILPGAIDTPMYHSANASQEAQDNMSKMHALKRVGTAEEVAKSILYLASDDSSFVTGTAHLVDGGISITRS